jgi:DNA-binding transcriptional regulator YiaG
MPNLSQVIKAEIARISRREIKSAVTPIRVSTIALRKSAADMKNRIARLESEVKRLSSLSATLQTNRKEPSSQTTDSKPRVTASGIRILRSKLGLSQESFGKLLGVSSQAVYIMEHKEGRLSLRSGTMANLLTIREMGKREAHAKLAEKEGAAPPTQSKKRALKR